jgi:hypothetical protein
MEKKVFIRFMNILRRTRMKYEFDITEEREREREWIEKQ